MGHELVIEVRGEAVGKAAPRFSPKTGRAYTATKSQAWMGQVQQAALAVAPEQPWEGPVSVSIVVTRAYTGAIRGSKSKLAKAERGEILPVSKPDVDNYAKGVHDALSGVVYRDDAQIVMSIVSKQYGDKPHTTIVVQRVGA